MPVNVAHIKSEVWRLHLCSEVPYPAHQGIEVRGFSGIFCGFLPGIWSEMVGNGLSRLGESSWTSFRPSCWFSGRFWRFLIFLIFWISGILVFLLKKLIFGVRYGFREAFQEIRNEISLPGTSGRPLNHCFRPSSGITSRRDTETSELGQPLPLRTQGWHTPWRPLLTSTGAAL